MGDPVHADVLAELEQPAALSPPSWGHRLDGIDGLRGVAALSVLVGHTVLVLCFSATVPPGLGPLSGLLLNGLTLFFVLSGFLLYRPFAAAAVHGRRPPATAAFLRNRVLRIWPAYVVVLLLAGWVLGTTVVHTDRPGALGADPAHFGRLTDGGQLLLNLVLLQGFFPTTVMSGLNVSWSLVPEVCFYLLLPLMGAACLRLARPLGPSWAAFVPALGLWLVGTVGRVLAFVAVRHLDADHVRALRAGPNWSTVLYRSILVQGDLFALGMIAGAAVVLAAARPDLVRSLRSLAWSSIVLGALGVLLLRTGDFVPPLMGLICAGLLMVMRLPAPGRLARAGTRVLEAAPIRWVGLCSYSVYLWHFPVLWWLRQHVPASHYTGLGGLVLAVTLVLAATLALAIPTYRVVEIPAMRRKRRA